MAGSRNVNMMHAWNDRREKRINAEREMKVSGCCTSAVAHGLLRMGGCCVNERTTHLMVVYPFAGVVPMSYMSYICPCVPLPSAFRLRPSFCLPLTSASSFTFPFHNYPITPHHITSHHHHHHTTITHTISLA
jgi:hypothetical protein